ncbi:hypothetical protein AB6O49_18935 [Streptomyces sp. SBR177]
MNGPQQGTPAHQGAGLHIHGAVSGSQIAVGNEQVTQNQINRTEAAADLVSDPVRLAAFVRELLQQLPEQRLAAEDREDTEAAANEVLGALADSDPPEPGRLRRAMVLLRGALTPVAQGVAAGATVGAQQWAEAALASLGG